MRFEILDYLSLDRYKNDEVIHGNNINLNIRLRRVIVLNQDKWNKIQCGCTSYNVHYHQLLYDQLLLCDYCWFRCFWYECIKWNGIQCIDGKTDGKHITDCNNKVNAASLWEIIFIGQCDTDYTARDC